MHSAQHIFRFAKAELVEYFSLNALRMYLGLQSPISCVSYVVVLEVDFPTSSLFTHAAYTSALLVFFAAVNPWVTIRDVFNFAKTESAKFSS